MPVKLTAEAARARRAREGFLEAYAMGRRWGENRMRDRVTRAMGRPEL